MEEGNAISTGDEHPSKLLLLIERIERGIIICVKDEFFLNTLFKFIVNR